MMQKRLLHRFFIILLVVVFMLSNSFDNLHSSSKITDLNIQDSYLIHNISYVAQHERNFCVYACLTMIFNFMGLNTSLNEMLFYSGVGYTHSYSLESRLPYEEIYQRFDFLYHVYGVSSRSWWPQQNNLSNTELWEQYFTRLKENITSDIPVVTMVDPFSLPSLRNQFKVSDFLWNKIFPSGRHVIVIIGFNEMNQTLCYNDPNAGYYGDSSFGDHAWINVSTFRQAQESLNERINEYHFTTYQRIDQPLSKKDAFEQAFQKNIENLTGVFPGHRRYYGIVASRLMQLDFSSEENNSLDTLHMYKTYGGTGVNFTVFMVMQKIFSSLNPLHPNIFDIVMAGRQSPFVDIAAIKSDVAEYLQNCSIQPSLCKYQSNLLRNESALWYDLAGFYNIFLRKGMFLSDIRAFQILHTMHTTMNDIIEIEETLIASS